MSRISPLAIHELNAFARFAAELAHIGGTLARTQIGTVPVERKGDLSLVTQADRAAQHAILSAIADRYPQHAVLGEETLAAPHRHAVSGPSDYCWVVDPIDGTRNYARGVESYVTSVGLLHRGVPVAGALYEPPRDRMFMVWRGGGAWRADGYAQGGAAAGAARAFDRMPSAPDKPIDTDTTIAISTLNGRSLTPLMRQWIETYVFRNAGSLCTHLIWVALGWVDGAYSTQAKLWDIAAGALLVEESGGRFTRPDGGPIWPIDTAAYTGADLPLVTGTPTFHAELLRSFA